jgi:hypothetical protein
MQFWLDAAAAECLAGFSAAAAADFGVAGDGAEAVVAEVLGGEAGVAEFFLDDGAVDCAGGSGDGPRYVQGPIVVTGSDPYGLDRDHDGIGCEPRG